MKSWLIERLVKWMTPRLRFIYHNPELWRYVESKGYHVTPVHYYQPIPDSRALDENYRAKSETVGIDWNEKAQLQLLRDVFPKYVVEYEKFFADFRADVRFAGEKLEFIGHDPYVYHCMIRHYKPGKVVEVGAGFSTLVAANAARENGETRVVAIEPYPNDFLGSISNEIHLVKGTAQSIDIDLLHGFTAERHPFHRQFACGQNRGRCLLSAAGNSAASERWRNRTFPRHILAFQLSIAMADAAARVLDRTVSSSRISDSQSARVDSVRKQIYG